MDTAKLLNEIFQELSKEVRTNQNLNARLIKIIEKHATGREEQPRRSHRRKPGAFDPMSVYRENSEMLRTRLNELNIDELKDIVAEQGMDRSKLAMKWKRKDRLINLIITTVESRIHKGDAFRIIPSKTRLKS